MTDDWFPEWWGKYVGMRVAYPKRKSGVIILPASGVKRLAALGLYSAKRARNRYQATIVVEVDFVRVCIDQHFRCWICGLPMSVNDRYSPKRISVDHDPPLSKAKRHDHTTVHAAHWDCNNRMGNGHPAKPAIENKKSPVD